MNVIHVFASNVRMYRKRLGLSQEAFAEKCGLHRTYISSLEREKRSISLKNIQLIAEALGIEPYRLFIEHDSPADLDAEDALFADRAHKQQ